MSKGFDTSKDLLFWSRRLLSIGGMWPLQCRPLLFYVWMVYCTFNLCLMLADLFDVLGDLHIVIANLNTTAPMIMVMSKVLVLGYSSRLRKFMRRVASDENAIDYKNEEERKIYMSYTGSVLKWFKIVLGITVAATNVYYFKKLDINYNPEPLDKYLEYPLPYRISISFNITDVRNYFLAYAYQGPMIYIYTCQTIVALFVWSLLIDACAQLSVLSFRIKNTKANYSKPDNSLESALRDIVQTHKKIIWNSKAIEGAFNIVLLVEIIFCTLIMGLCMYNVIMNSSFKDATEFLSFFLYIFMMVLVMYGYCLAGDLLVQESLNLRDSYYECDWYNMPPRCKKMIIMCMMRTQIPLQITGGGFYIYSVESFTVICKTAIAYGSMLRQVA